MQFPKRENMDKRFLPWALLKEPKFVSAMWATIYSVFGVNGIIFIAFTPGELVDHDGIAISLVIGVLLIIGGGCGAVSLHGGQWFLERAGLYFNIGGIITYIGIVWYVSTSVGELLIRTGWAIVTICVLLTRIYTIREFTLDPRK